MPTQTVTPSATWSNTSSEQQNGDVADATVLQATGKAALSNIAYLTGSNTRTQVSRIQTCTDLTALKAIGTSDRRDMDVCIIDTANGERLYKFDSGSSSTGDDFAVVTPASGSGRWHLVGARPASTSKTWSLAGSAFFGLFDSNHNPTFTYASGQLQSDANDSPTVQGTFSGFNPGDVLSSAKVLCVSSGTPSNGTVTVYAVTPGDSSNTVTTLGTATLTQPLSAVTTITFGSPYTFTEGDTIFMTVYLHGGTGTWTLKNARIFGTRSYITQ